MPNEIRIQECEAHTITFSVELDDEQVKAALTRWFVDTLIATGDIGDGDPERWVGQTVASVSGGDALVSASLSLSVTLKG